MGQVKRPRGEMVATADGEQLQARARWDPFPVPPSPPPGVGVAETDHEYLVPWHTSAVRAVNADHKSDGQGGSKLSGNGQTFRQHTCPGSRRKTAGIRTAHVQH